MVLNRRYTRSDDIKILERRRDVAQFYVQGKTQWEIVLLIRDDWPGISQKTISTDLEWIQTQWLDNIKESVDKRKSIELAKINHLEQLALEGYARSLQGISSTRKVSELAPDIIKRSSQPSKSMNGKGKSKFPKIREVECKSSSIEDDKELELIKRTVEECHKGSNGDPRFLTQVQWCIEMRLNLFGIKIGEVNNNTYVNIDFESMMRRNTGNETNPLQNALHELDNVKVIQPLAIETVESSIDDMTMESVEADQVEEESRTKAELNKLLDLPSR